MATKIDINALRSAFKKTGETNTVGQNNYYPFYNMQVGEQSIVRWLADKNDDNPLGFLVEKLMHTLVINGERKSVPCLKMYGEECPICKVSSAFYKNDDKENGKLYYRKKQYIGHVLVLEDPLPANADTGESHEGKTRFVAIGNQLYDVIKDAFEEGDLDDLPFSYTAGTNFIIKKTEKGGYAAYDRSKFAKNSSALDPVTVEHVGSGLVDLSTLLPKHPGREKVEQMLEAALKGTPYVAPTAGGSDDSDHSTTVVTTPKQAATETAKGEDDESVNILAQIRKRASERATAGK
jgi:hypothetical protein